MIVLLVAMGEALLSQLFTKFTVGVDILGRSFGVFGYTKTDLREIAIRNRLREDGVEKAKKQALKKLRERCLDSTAWKLRKARRMVDRAASLEQLF